MPNEPRASCMKDLWQMYANMWRASFGEMPHVGTFGARVFLILWHALLLLSLILFARIFA